MKNRMTIVQALDERELLVKKIKVKMQKAQFVDLMKPKAAVTLENRVAKAVFTTQARSALQQLEDMISRFDALNEAITYSNASTFLDTSRLFCHHYNPESLRMQIKLRQGRRCKEIP